MKQADYIHRRLHPSRSMPEYYTLHHLWSKVTEMVSVLERSAWTPPIRVLDAGAGCAPYKDLFAARHFQYVAADAQTISRISLVADGQQLPFSDGAFDLVLSNQVLEHVSDPKRVSRELMRVVSDRGYLFLSCPFVWEIHNFPGDYWRFSKQALRLLFADMDLVYLEPSTTTAQCLVQSFNLFINRNFSNEFFKALLFRVTNSRLVLAGMPAKDELLAANYVLVARSRTAFEDGDKRLSSAEASEMNMVAGSDRVQPLPDTEGFRLQVDTPQDGVPVKGPMLKVAGWIAGDSPIDQAWARIEGAAEWVLDCNLRRVDVWRAFPQFRNAHRSGFFGECDIGGLRAGEHFLEIVGKTRGKTLTWRPVKFRVVDWQDA